LPDQRFLAIQPLDPSEDDSLTSELLESNPEFQALVAKSIASPRRPFPSAQPKRTARPCSAPAAIAAPNAELRSLLAGRRIDLVRAVAGERAESGRGQYEAAQKTKNEPNQAQAPADFRKCPEMPDRQK
jgi:hypothetical protein